MPKSFAATAGILLLLTTPAAAQGPSAPSTPRIGIGVAPHVGTLGIGIDVAVGGMGPLAVRAGANYLPVEVTGTESDIEYAITAPKTHFTLLVDVAAPVGVRVTGGLLFSPSDIEAVGQLAGTVEVGNMIYNASDVGSLSGAIVNRDVAPYLGIGWGKPASQRVGFFLDLGVGFHGAPTVDLTATGPIALDAQFQADLEAERQSLEDDLSWFTVYPVISLGFSIGL